MIAGIRDGIWARRAARLLAAAAVLGTGMSVAPRPLSAAPASNDGVIVDAAAREASLKSLWAKKLYLALEGESLHELAAKVLQETMIRMTVERDLVDEPYTVACTGSTFADLRDAFTDLCGFQIQPAPRFESLVFLLIEPPAVRDAALAKDPPPVKHPPVPKATVKGSKPQPVSVARTDAELLKPLVIARDLSPIEKEDLFLPAIQQRVARCAGIRILSDYADRTETSLGKQPAEAFFRSLKGMPLGQVLDKIAVRFDYTWRKSHGWYLFRSKHWKAERRERMAQAEAAENDQVSAAPRRSR
jgi:hypothetical protein